MKYSNEELLKMYEHLVRARIWTLGMHECVNNGLICGAFHTPYGQEAMGVGVACAMGADDWVIPTHRSQTLMLTKYDPYKFTCEVLGRENGYAKGTARDLHITDLEKEHTLPQSGTLGASAGHCAGAALAVKLKKLGGAVISLQGEGAWSEGICYEVVNIACLMKLPIVFVAEINGWAMTVPTEREAVNGSISERVAPWGAEIHTLDIDEGSDVVKIRETMEDALEKARAFRPQFVEVKDTRWAAHFVGQGDHYYTEEEKEQLRLAKENRDCIRIMEKYLLDSRAADEKYFAEVKDRIQEEIAGYIDMARDIPGAAPEEIYTPELIYAEPETGGEI